MGFPVSDELVKEAQGLLVGVLSFAFQVSDGFVENLLHVVGCLGDSGLDLLSLSNLMLLLKLCHGLRLALEPCLNDLRVEAIRDDLILDSADNFAIAGICSRILHHFFHVVADKLIAFVPVALGH